MVQIKNLVPRRSLNKKKTKSNKKKERRKGTRDDDRILCHCIPTKHCDN